MSYSCNVTAATKAEAKSAVAASSVVIGAAADSRARQGRGARQRQRAIDLLDDDTMQVVVALNGVGWRESLTGQPTTLSRPRASRRVLRS